MKPTTPCALLILLAACASGAAPAVPGGLDPADGAAAQEALAVVVRLFDGMRARDTALIRSTLHPDARLVTAGEQGGVPTVRQTPIDAFLVSVASAEEVLDERLYGPEVRVDGNLATVWTHYDFRVGERFSHCGVDAFQLARTADGWRIIQIADTRRRERCPTADRPE